MSMPCSSGRNSAGVPKVLSTPIFAPWPCAILCELGKIRNRQSRIADRFGPDQSSSIADGRIDRRRIGHVDQGHLDTRSVADFVQQAIGAAVQITTGNDVIAAATASW